MVHAKSAKKREGRKRENDQENLVSHISIKRVIVIFVVMNTKLSRQPLARS